MRTLGFWIAAISFSLLLLKHAPAQTGIECIKNAFKFCPKETRSIPIMPDAIKACLRFHERQLTAECRATLKASK